MSDPSTARVLDAFNVAYEIVLYTLARYFGHGSESDDQLQKLADVAVGLMVTVLKPLGEFVTTLPVGRDHPGMTAGPSFELFYGSGYLLPHREAAWTLLHERLDELATFLTRLDDTVAPARVVAPTVARYAEVLGSELATPSTVR